MKTAILSPGRGDQKVAHGKTHSVAAVGSKSPKTPSAPEGAKESFSTKTKWQSRLFGDVCGLVRGPFGGSLKKSVFVNDGFAVYEQQHAIYNQFEDIRYFINDAKFQEMKRFELRPHDLIMSCSGTMGRVAIVPKSIRRGVINQALLKLTPTSAVTPEFLKYWMDSNDFQDSLKEQSGGAAIQNVASVSILKEIKIPLPPLPEQHRLVTLLDQAFAAIATAQANTEKNLQNAHALFESHLQSVFGIAAHGWGKTTLGDVCEQITDGKHGDCKNKIESGYYFLSAKDVKGGTLNYDGAREITQEDFEETHRRTRLQPGDILITNSGTIGRMAVAPDDVRTSRTTFQKSVAILKPKRAIIDSRFVFYCLSSGLSRFVGLSAGAAQKNLLLRDLRSYAFHLPAQIDQQAKVAEDLDALSAETQRLTSLYQQKLTALAALKKSLLHQAFTGQL